ncbi:hypothetical protein VTN49DRAFT_5890 [Thermomyces lanuginosus]|uniref:uncharacterized protein n=1 Tax=Thermomyces lanuginosus TaxID=5541 RepID=UPI003742DF0E
MLDPVGCNANAYLHCESALERYTAMPSPRRPTTDSGKSSGEDLMVRPHELIARPLPMSLIGERGRQKA